MIRKYISYIVLTLFFSSVGISCSDSFLDQPPPGTYSDVSLQNLKGVEGMLIATYAALDGSYFESWDNNYFNQNAGASNWIWGSIRAGDAYKGTEPNDGVDINPIERHEAQPSNAYLVNKWTGTYDGIAKANQTLRVLKAATEAGTIDAATSARIEGEARFLRAHFHFEVLKVFGIVPFVGEDKISAEDLATIQNDHMIWPEIEADFQFAHDNLPGMQINDGRANKWAAAAYLAKVYVFQAKWAAAEPLFDEIIAQGTTAGGVPYDLCDEFYHNYRVTMEKGNPESVFAYEASFGDGTIGNGNYENTLNQPHGSSAEFAGCCGFFQPSQNLVNSYKVDAVTGLPLFDTYNDSDITNDEGLLSNDPFTPDLTTPVDPRLDWTVGRRGLPYLDWGLHPGNNWIRQVSNGGPYSPKKNVPWLADEGTTAGSLDWGFTGTAQNVHIIRYADVLLLAAETKAELNKLDEARTLVNEVRARAANSPVYTYVNDDPAQGFTNTPAANYVVGQYPAFGTRAEALRAIRFERKLELAMEGHRFFDLVRWDAASQAGLTGLPFDIVDYMNSEYLAEEKTKRNHISGVTFERKYRYEPIPEYVITQSTVGGVKMIDQSTEWGGSRQY